MLTEDDVTTIEGLIRRMRRTHAACGRIYRTPCTSVSVITLWMSV
jgi:hypothetical protein